MLLLDTLLRQYEHTLAKLVLMASEDRSELQDSSGDEIQDKEPPNTDLADPERRIWIFTTAWYVHMIGFRTKSLSCTCFGSSNSRQTFHRQKRQLAFDDSLSQSLRCLMALLRFKED
jgi:hypothetical protein